MGQQEIRCTVNSCYYYETNDRCVAERIMVRNNPAFKGDATRLEVGELGATANPRVSEQTMCETFIPERLGPKGQIRRIDTR